MIPLVDYKFIPYILLTSVTCAQASQRPRILFCLFKVMFKLQLFPLGKQTYFQVLEVAFHFGSCELPTMKNISHEKYVKSSNPQLFSSAMGVDRTGKSIRGEKMGEKMGRRFQICLQKVQDTLLLFATRSFQSLHSVYSFEEFIDLWLDEPTGKFCMCTRPIVFATCQGEGQVSCDWTFLRILIRSLTIQGICRVIFSHLRLVPGPLTWGRDLPELNLSHSKLLDSVQTFPNKLYSQKCYVSMLLGNSQFN